MAEVTGGVEAIFNPAANPLFESTISDDLLPSVDFAHERAHAFKKRKDGKRGCEMCGLAKIDLSHHGMPPSLNVYGSRGAQRAYNELKHRWQRRFLELLHETDLPKGLGFVLAEGQMIFGDRHKRDQGNYRFMVEKALGDALVEGAYLPEDSWAYFEFGRLRYAYQKGQAATVITLHPSWRLAE